MTAARDTPGYNAAHQRVRRARGPAKAHTCACGQQAVDWSYIGDGPFGDPDQYVPRCRPCHTVADGTMGEAHPNARLTADEVRSIRRQAGEGRTQRDLASAYGITQANVSLIVRREAWKHITD